MGQLVEEQCVAIEAQNAMIIALQGQLLFMED